MDETFSILLGRQQIDRIADWICVRDHCYPRVILQQVYILTKTLVQWLWGDEVRFLVGLNQAPVGFLTPCTTDGAREVNISW